MAEDRPPRLRVFDMLDCIRQIELNARGLDAEALCADALRYRAIERWVEIISEASRYIDNHDKTAEPAVEWKQLANFGNILRHGYHVIDHRIIWNIITYDLPLLKRAATRLYGKLKQPADPWPDAESE